MQVRVLTDDFKLSAVLDKILYLKYSERFSDAGKLYMRLPLERDTYVLLKPPCRLLVGELLYTVERRKCSGDALEVYAKGIFDDFKHFDISEPRSILGKPSDIVYMLASEVSFNGVDYQVYGVSDTGEAVRESLAWCTSYKSTISRICHEAGLGFRIVFDGMERKIKFIVDKIFDKATANASAYTVISDRRESFVDFESDLDISNYKTRIAFAYRINAIDSYKSYIYDRTPEGELPRTYTENPHIIANTTEELFKFLDTRAEEIFKWRSRTRAFRVRLRSESKHILGNLCYLENTALGECAHAVLTEREVIFDGNEVYEELILEEK